MGTRKNLVLASLVSMMMVLAGMIGLVPSQNPAEINAGADAGRIEMAQLLDLIFGNQLNNDISVTTPWGDQATFVIPPASQDFLLPLDASHDDPNTGDTLTLVANDINDQAAFFNPAGWTGTVFSAPLGVPYDADLNVGPLLSGVNGISTTLKLYALLNTAELTANATLSYEAQSMPLNVTIREADLDSDGNSYLDNLALLGPGEEWRSGNVVVINLDDNSKQTGMTVVNGNVTVTGPSKADLVDESLVAANENADGVHTSINEGVPEPLFINPADTAAIANWATSVASYQPGMLVPTAQFVEVSLIYTFNGGTEFSEIQNLSDTENNLAIDIVMSGLSGLEAGTPALYSFPTRYESDALDNLVLANDIAAEDAGANWTEVDAAPIVDVVNGEISSFGIQNLSVFAPLNTGLTLSAITESSIPANQATDILLTGVIPVMPAGTALNAAAATAAYTVYIGPIASGVTASFTNIAEAITAFNEGTENTAAVTTPALAVGVYDVTIVDNADNSRMATLTGGLTVLDAFALTLNVDDQTTAANITLSANPTNSPNLTVGNYLNGTSVTVTADNFDAVTQDIAWTLNDVAQAETSGTFIVNMGQDNTLLATITDKVPPTVTLTLNLDDQTANGNIALSANPISGAGQSDLVYNTADNTVVTITATNFDPAIHTIAWTVDGAAVAGGNAIDVNMDADKTVAATVVDIVGGGFVLTLDLTDSTSAANIALDAQPANSPGLDPLHYATGTVVTITAQNYDAAIQDIAWTVDGNAVAGTDSITVTMDNNKTVAAAITDKAPTINGMTPWNAPVFGGIVAQINGSGLSNDTVITIGGSTVQGFRAATDGTSVEVVVPAMDIGTETSMAVDVVVTTNSGSATLTDGFTYKRVYAGGQAINTAASFDGGIGVALGIAMGDIDDASAQVVIPPLTASGETIHVIVRSALPAVAKQNTSPLGTDVIDAILGAGNAGSQIAGASDFSVFFYTDAAKQGNTPAVGSAVLASANTLLDATPGANTGAMTLSYPVDAAGLTAADVRSGLSLWGIANSFNFVTDTQTTGNTAAVAYQSSLGRAEVTPNVLPDVEDTEAINAVLNARLYSLNSFSLRSGAPMAPDVAAAIRAENAPATPFQGPITGGTEITITSSLGGLSWIDRLEFSTTSKQGLVVSTAGPDEFITEPGTDEYLLTLNTAAATRAGVTDVSIFLAGILRVPPRTERQPPPHPRRHRRPHRPLRGW